MMSDSKKEVYLLWTGNSPGSVPFYKTLLGVFSSHDEMQEAFDSISESIRASQGVLWHEVWYMDNLKRLK